MLSQNIMDKYYREVFPVIMRNMKKAAAQNFQKYRAERAEFRICFDMPGKRNYREFAFLFQPDPLDRERKLYRLFGMVPLRWNPEYSLEAQFKKGMPEELCDWIGSAECEEMVKKVSERFDKSERHDGP